MAAKLSPDMASGRRPEPDLPLGAALEQLAFQLERGLISPQAHAVRKARLLAANSD